MQFPLRTLFPWVALCFVLTHHLLQQSTVHAEKEAAHLPSVTARRSVLTSSYMRGVAAHYYIAGYLTTRNATDFKTGPDVGKPFVEKHLLSRKSLLWRFEFNETNVQISSLAPNARGMSVFVAGHIHDVDNKGRVVQRLFLAEIEVGWTGRRLRKVVYGEPVAFLRVNKIVVEGSYVFLCGSSVGLGNSTLPDSFALMYNSSLSLKWTGQRHGLSSRETCSDILLADRAAKAYKVSTNLDVTTGRERIHGEIQVFHSTTGKLLWSVVLNPHTVQEMARRTMGTNSPTQAIGNIPAKESNLALSQIIIQGSALYLTGKISERRNKKKARNVIVKVGKDSGLVLWAQESLLPSGSAQELELIGVSGIAYAADDYIYTISRYRESPSSFSSIAARTSIYRDFSPDKDVSSPIWRSSSSMTPEIGFTYSNIAGAILAFGESSQISISNATNSSYVELPIGPLTNHGAHSLCLGCLGPKFVRICFEMVTANATLTSLNVVRETLTELFRVMWFQLSPVEQTAKQNGAEKSEEYCVFLRGEDLGLLEQKLRSRIRTFVMDVDHDGRNEVERRLNAPSGTIFFRDKKLTVKSQGVTEQKGKVSKKRSAYGFADDFLRYVTFVGVIVAVLATLIVVVIGIVGEVRKSRRKRQNESLRLSDGQLAPYRSL